MKILVEGLWGLGKTTLCKNLEKGGFEYHPEPNIRDFNGERENLVKWFLSCYENNINSQLQQKNNSVSERSAISTLSFEEAKNGRESFDNSLLQKYSSIDLVLLIGSSNIDQYVEKVAKKHNIWKVIDDKNFYGRYQKILINNLSKFNKKVIFIDALKEDFLPHQEIYKNVKKKYL